MTGPRLSRAAHSPEFYFREGCYITEHWNVPDDPALSLARARVPPGITTRRHRLEGITERYLILAGTGRVEVAGLPATTVTPGDVVVIPPGAARSRRARPSALPARGRRIWYSWRPARPAFELNATRIWKPTPANNLAAGPHPGTRRGPDLCGGPGPGYMPFAGPITS